MWLTGGHTSRPRRRPPPASGPTPRYEDTAGCERSEDGVRRRRDATEERTEAHAVPSGAAPTSRWVRARAAGARGTSHGKEHCWISSATDVHGGSVPLHAAIDAARASRGDPRVRAPVGIASPTRARERAASRAEGAGTREARARVSARGERSERSARARGLRASSRSRGASVVGWSLVPEREGAGPRAARGAGVRPSGRDRVPSSHRVGRRAVEESAVSLRGRGSEIAEVSRRGS